jgi:hypothetical protein
LSLRLSDRCLLHLGSFFTMPITSSSLSRLMAPVSLLWCAGLLGLFCSPGRAQETIVPTITFSCDFPGSDPEHYSISIGSDGHSTYESDGKLDGQSEAVAFHRDFTISEPTRARVFDLAKRTHYFEGKIDSGKKNIASSGMKTLAYKDPSKTTQATYNYSPSVTIQELTALLQNLSITLEFGRRLEFYDHFQKLALDAELKNMEVTAQRNGLEEIGAIAPILRAISEEPAIMNMVRARAQRLLATTTAK